MRWLHKREHGKHHGAERKDGAKKRDRTAQLAEAREVHAAKRTAETPENKPEGDAGPAC